MNSGLISALTSHLESLTNQSIINPTELKISLLAEGFGDERLPTNTETDIYRVVQQAIANAIEHAEASTIKIHLKWSNEECRFTIEDDGRGMGDINRENVVKSGHFGLANMRDRIERNGGALEFGSTVPSGTTLTGTIPTENRTGIPNITTDYDITISNT